MLNIKGEFAIDNLEIENLKSFKKNSRIIIEKQAKTIIKEFRGKNGIQISLKNNPGNGNSILPVGQARKHAVII